MNELNEKDLELVVSKQELGVLETNARNIKEKVLEVLPNYSADNYDENNIDVAKADKALLNKSAKALNDKRIVLEKKFNEPFEIFKATIKETTDLIKEASSKIDEVVKDVENKEKSNRKEIIVKYYEENINELKDILPLEKIFEDKWLNKGSFNDKGEFKLVNELQDKINRVRNDLIAIGELHSKYEVELKNDYLNNGYELTDLVGISYLEKEYEEYLKGKKAKYKVGSDYSLTKVNEEEKGYDLVLSIDIDLQMKVEEIIKDKINLGKRYGNTEYFKDGYAIVSNPLTGEILALGGQRLNDDNSFSDISLNTTNKSYTIGSAVKGATIGVGYKYNLITPGAFINDACVKLYLVPEKCSFKRLGKVNDLTALANSSNYYQYMIAIKLTGNNYKPNVKLNATKEHFDIYRNMLASFGLGVKTEIDLPGEEIGIIGSTIADDLLLNLSIGQYDTYTPLEVLQYINSVASGKRMKLSLMKEIRNKDDVILKNDINILNDVDLDEDSLERIREGMRLVLSEGTGKFYVPQGFDFAGKTGTSESFLDTNNDGKVDTATISSTFTGFYPSEDPKFSLVVITPNISHKNGKTEAFYYGASKITKDIVNFLNSNY